MRINTDYFIDDHTAVSLPGRYSVFNQYPHLLQLFHGAVDGRLIVCLDGVQVDAFSEKRERHRRGFAAFFDEHVDIAAACKVEAPRNLSVDGVLDDDVDDCAALIDETVKFVFHCLTVVPAGNTAGDFPGSSGSRENVAARCGEDVFSGRPEERNVTYDDLPAYAEFPASADALTGIVPSDRRSCIFFLRSAASIAYLPDAFLCSLRTISENCRLLYCGTGCSLKSILL